MESRVRGEDTSVFLIMICTKKTSLNNLLVIMDKRRMFIMFSLYSRIM